MAGKVMPEAPLQRDGKLLDCPRHGTAGKHDVRQGGGGNIKPRHSQPGGRQQARGHGTGTFAVHGKRDGGIQQSLFLSQRRDAHHIRPGLFDLPDCPAPFLPCAPVAAMPEPHAHGLRHGQSRPNASVRIGQVDLRAGNHGPPPEGERQVRRAQHFKRPDIAAYIDAFDHALPPCS